MRKCTPLSLRSWNGFVLHSFLWGPIFLPCLRVCFIRRIIKICDKNHTILEGQRWFSDQNSLGYTPIRCFSVYFVVEVYFILNFATSLMFLFCFQWTRSASFIVKYRQVFKYKRLEGIVDFVLYFVLILKQDRNSRMVYITGPKDKSIVLFFLSVLFCVSSFFVPILL